MRIPRIGYRHLWQSTTPSPPSDESLTAAVPPQSDRPAAGEDGLAQAILAYTERRGFASFVEVEQLVESLGVSPAGDASVFCGDPSLNVVAWSGLSCVVAEAVCKLLREELVYLKPVSWFHYLADGKQLALPLVR